jgi:formate-dependent nitrite reductase membrane component NrfD
MPDATQQCGQGTNEPSCVMWFLKQNAAQLIFGGVLFGLVVTFLLSKQMNPYLNPTAGNIVASGLVLLGILSLVGVDVWPLIFPPKTTN